MRGVSAGSAAALSEDLASAVDDGADLLRDEDALLRIDAVLARAEQRLTGELEQDAAETGALDGRPGLGGPSGAVGHSASPSW